MYVPTERLVAPEGLDPTLLGAHPNYFMIKVYNHKLEFNGQVCPLARSHFCGAKQWFREQYCEPMDHPPDNKCPDMYAFAQENPHIRRFLWEQQYDRFKLLKVIKRGDLLVFWTQTHNEYGVAIDSNPFLVGLYAVGDARGEREDHGNFVFFPRAQDGMVHFDFPIRTRDVVTLIFQPIQRLAHDEMLDMLQNIRLKIGERERFARAQSSDEQIVLYGNQSRTLDRLIDEYRTPPPAERAPAPALDNRYRPAATVTTTVPGSNSASGPRTTSDLSTDTRLVTPPIVVPPVVERTPTPTRIDSATAELARQATREGLFYPNEVLTRFLVSMSTGGFVILSGPSGTGKSRLSHIYARAQDAEFDVIPVKPDWVSTAYLWGSYDYLAARFVPEAFAERVRAASDEWKRSKEEGRESKQYVVCLDEMNLARVEYYLADLLSAMERPPLERVVTLYSVGREKPDDFPAQLLLPPNLRLVGTINVDETTYSLSPKVLDRSHVIRLDHVDLEKLRELMEEEWPDDGEMLDYVFSHLVAINATMSPDPSQQFGYRVARQIAEWVIIATQEPYNMPVTQALDAELTQKVLPRLRIDPDNEAQRDLLHNLIEYFETYKSDLGRTFAWLRTREERMNSLAEAISGQQ